MAAGLLGAALGAGASIFGSMQQKKAADKAARMQQEAANQAMAERRAALEQAGQYYDQGLGYYQTFLPMGEDATGYLRQFYSADPTQQQAALAQYEGSPLGQLFARNRENAIRQVQGENAARGAYRSGGTMTDLVNRTSAVDTQGLLSYLSGINQNAQMGFNAAQGSNLNRMGLGGLQVGTSNNIAGDIIGAGVNNANAGMAGSTAMTRGISQAGGILGDQLGTSWNNYLKSPTNPASWNTTTTPEPGYTGPGAYTSWGTTVTPANNFTDFYFPGGV